MHGDERHWSAGFLPSGLGALRLDRDALSIAEVQNILMAYVIVLNRATGAPASARRAPARNR
jgi:hypothetical protein